MKQNNDREEGMGIGIVCPDELRIGRKTALVSSSLQFVRTGRDVCELVVLHDRPILIHSKSIGHLPIFFALSNLACSAAVFFLRREGYLLVCHCTGVGLIWWSGC
jgi:hypothetical protein